MKSTEPNKKNLQEPEHITPHVLRKHLLDQGFPLT